MDERATLNISRVLKKAAFGFFIVGPAMVNWYRLLSRIQSDKRPVLALVGRVALDQTIWAPVAVAAFFVANNVMDGQGSLLQIRQKLKQVYVETLLANWQLWPAVQLLNFHFVPVNYQAIVVSSVALGWNAFLSRQAARSQQDEARRE